MNLLSVYRENPFFILTASAKNSRAELIEKQEEMALFGDESAADRALSILLNPQTRTEAEMHWFPLMDEEQIQELMAFFDRHWQDTEMPAQTIPSMLGQFNMLRLALGRIQVQNASELQAVFQSIAMAADGLIPAQVMEELNHDRRQAGFPEISNQSEIEPLIRDLLNETGKAYWETVSGRISDKERLEAAKAFRTAYKSASSPYHNSYFLEIAADQLDTENRNGSGANSMPPAPEQEERKKPYQFSKKLQFPRDKDVSLKQLNEELAKLKLSNVDIRECKGFMFTEKTMGKHEEVTSVRYGFGFDSIILDCEQKGNLYTWQVDVEVIRKKEQEEIDISAFNEKWRAKHPDRVMRSTIQYSFQIIDAMIVLYHELQVK